VLAHLATVESSVCVVEQLCVSAIMTVEVLLDVCVCVFVMFVGIIVYVTVFWVCGNGYLSVRHF